MDKRRRETLTEKEEILKHALSMEIRDYDVYQECHKVTERPGLRQLFGSLASQEKEHAKKLEDLIASMDPDDIFDTYDAQAVNPDHFATAKKIEPAMNFNDLLISIIDREEKAAAFYSFLSGCTRVSEIAFLFSTLALEEQKHKSWAVDRYELEMLA